MYKFNIGTFNVKGLASKSKRDQVLCWLNKLNLSIVLLQEIHFSCSNDNTNWSSSWDGLCYLSGNSTNSLGVGIFINKTCNCKVIEYQEIIIGRMQRIQLQIDDNIINLFNVYGPNIDDVKFFDTLESNLKQYEDQTLMIGGDSNTVLDYHLDKLNGRNDTNKRTSLKVNQMIETYDLCDVFRILNPGLKLFTWHSNNNPPILCRLDYILMSSNIINSVVDSKIKAGYRSDHSLVTVNLNFSKHEKGPGYFKVNNSLLLDTEYQNKMRNSIQEIALLNSSSNANTLWEIIKGRIRDETIKFASIKKKNDLKEEKELNVKIESLEKELTKNPNSETTVENIKTEKSKLNDLIDKRIKGILLRSKAEWIEGSEKNSKYFANLEKKRAEQKNIKQIRDNTNNILSDPKPILKYAKEFYENLYSKDENIEECDNSPFFLNEVKTVTDNNETEQSGHLSEYECGIALKEMKNNKSPGSDGITAEFYKIFWNDIKQYLVNSLNYSFEHGSLTELQKQGIISLLPKKDKDTLSINNWRPISLLNVDYKIASKAIANRIKTELPNIIDTEQTGFIKGRYIGENIRLLQEAIEYINSKNENGLILFSDFNKAFDSLDHNFMKKCLYKFKISNSVIKWVDHFYKDAKSCITNNGKFSEFFKIDKGVRQGCPLSPYLFIICIELLANEIRKNKDIKGIKINNIELKQTLFADDACFLTNGEQNSFLTLMKTLENFSYISGLKLNKNKCTILKLGRLRYANIERNYGKKYNWTSTSASTLGITFTNNSKDMIELNFNPKLKDFENCLNKWKRWKLSLIGKITVLKTFEFPKLVYPLTVLPNPSQEFIDKVKSLMFKFLWDDKPDKISRNKIIQDYKQGGLRMIDLESFIHSLKCSWIKRMKFQKESKWVQLYDSMLSKYGKQFIVKCNLSPTDVQRLDIKSNFLKNVLFAWSCANYKENINSVGKQILWNNAKIKSDGNTVFTFVDWLEKGIMFIEHIFDYRNKQFYKFEHLQNLYDIPRNDYLKYHRLISSIPPLWKNKLKNEEIDYRACSFLIDKLCPKTKTCKFIYNVLIKNKIPPGNNHENKWQQCFSTELNWEMIFNQVNRVTIDTKLRSFQYKYLMHIVPNNEKLFKYGLVEASTCDFCRMSVESNKHLFWECTSVQPFWSSLKTYLNTKLPSFNQIHFTYESISLCNITHNNRNASNCINFIIILAKYFIHKNKYQEHVHNFDEFILYLSHRIKLEGLIAEIKGKTEAHTNKWSPFLR